MKDNKDIYKYGNTILYKITRPIITFLFKVLYTPKYEGKENIPTTGRVILAGNHTNNFDSLLLISSTKRNIHFLAKDELWHGKFRFIFSNMGLIPVNRRTKDPQAVNLAIKYLNNNELIGIFPEGTIEVEKNKVMDFKIGAVKMAHDTSAPIIPFVITGDYKLFSRNLKIKFLPAFIVGNNLEGENEYLKELIKIEIEGEKNGII